MKRSHRPGLTLAAVTTKDSSSRRKPPKVRRHSSDFPIFAPLPFKGLTFNCLVFWLSQNIGTWHLPSSPSSSTSSWSTSKRRNTRRRAVRCAFGFETALASTTNPVAPSPFSPTWSTPRTFLEVRRSIFLTTVYR